MRRTQRPEDISFIELGYSGLVYSNWRKLLFTIGDLYPSSSHAIIGTEFPSLFDGSLFNSDATVVARLTDTKKNRENMEKNLI